MPSDYEVTGKALCQAAGHSEPWLILEGNQAVSFSGTAETGFMPVCN